MDKLFQSVIWPAIAGNVAWAFFTVAIQEYAVTCRVSFSERLLLLGVVAMYLFLDWTHTEQIRSQLRKYYWVADAFLAITIAGLAIAAQAKVGQGKWYLLAVFVVATIAQMCNAWADKTKQRGSKCLWWLVVYATATALMFNLETQGDEWGLHLPISAGFVVTFWMLARFTSFRLFNGLRD